ncbi:SDR family NAD(P)-dependent oxidoreductase [Rhodococcus opacus]|uniref:SDR family NAD(P)-dependent oxidoreductase n=1 Tax=Rhodococcus opacus TaxID=37919 RepID=UPI00294A61F1|nr:SDR family oxidoreductase [Rhodococcus opacus]MDV6247191.1 SDR family oxidoreductase [Rhodococcus opacus]
MHTRFNGQVGIVTGAATGIGRAIATALTREGATVIVGDIDDDGLATLASETGAHPVRADSSEESAASELVAKALEVGGRLDLLVNNAGVHRSVPTTEMTPAAWRQVIDLNLNGYFYTARAAGQEMIKQRSGSILNIGSTASVSASLNSAAYVASKHGVLGLTRALAVDWAQYGVRVNALAPGLTTTEMVHKFQESAPELYDVRRRRVPLQRAASADEQAAAALFLLSDESGYTTGQVLVVDGGGQALYSGYEAPQGPVQD